jgi:hypothetical protein
VTSSAVIGGWCLPVLTRTGPAISAVGQACPSNKRSDSNFRPSSANHCNDLHGYRKNQQTRRFILYIAQNCAFWQYVVVKYVSKESVMTGARTGPGYSKNEFSRLSGIPYRRVQLMVALKELKTVTYGGVEKIIERELPRILDAYGVIEPQAESREVESVIPK